MQKSFQTPSHEVFRPRRTRFLRPSTFGFSRLAIQLIVLKLTALAVLYVAVLAVADLRGASVDAVARSLIVQSDGVAAALARARSAETGVPLLQPAAPTAPAAPDAAAQPSEADADAAPDAATAATGAVARSNGASPIAATDGAADQPAAPAPAEDAASVSRGEVGTFLRRVLEGSPARVRIFDANGERILDSAVALAGEAAAPRIEAPDGSDTGALLSLWRAASDAVLAESLPPEPDDDGPAVPLPEVEEALGGIKSVVRRATADGDVLISVATPVRDARGEVVGVLHLRSGPGVVTGMARRQELAITQVFLLAGVAAVIVSLILAGTIMRPVRRLAAAADRIRSSGMSGPMPELRDRGEVGDLSRVLHDMTAALYERIDSIEAFAAEVAHELKNPLTSLRSAVETLPMARTEKSRDRLLDVIEHDVRRIDRLISDISDASKLDAELNRFQYQRFDLIQLLRTVVNMQSELAADRGQSVELIVRGDPDPSIFQVFGNDGRLGQVFTNLLDNARSFTPNDGRVVIAVQRFDNFIEVVVDDEGPGIADDTLERIFERFYTDRSGQSSFGDNSGLGLAISRQIVEAHSGEIFAENLYRTTLGPDNGVGGARFTVRLPVSL